MSQKRFDKGMKELKQKYTQAEPTTSAKEIFQSVQQSKLSRRNKFVTYIPAIAASIGILFIAGILFTSLLSGNQFSFDDSANYELSNGPLRENAVLDSSDNEIEEDMAESGDLFIDRNNNGEVVSDDFNSPVEYRVALEDRSPRIVKEINVGGENIHQAYELYVNQALRFSTYVDSTMTIEEDIKTEKVSFTLTERTWISITRLGTSENIDVHAVEREYESNFEEEGFVIESSSTEQSFNNVDFQGFLNHPDDWINLYYAFIEDNGVIYYVEAQQPVNSEYVTFHDSIQTFVEELVVQ
ncbi:hypothetical protein QA612_02530 [Evansella sp. AB-P1]|uniref:hypothetical protein n=1 Tax=Evansella sp. AB-P1 TaxID=3037653 RepID=UPI00241DE0E8|nr:hypothetical protein [Evansella sp. AB-P1]MDG5786351.1 hypothetical protein [Evansella sp. AB-P1]